MSICQSTMLGLGHGLSRSIWDCFLFLGWSFHQGPVRFMPPPVRSNPSDLPSFQLPNTVFPHASNQYTQSARFATVTKLSTCDDIFGALSTDGELFIFSPPESKAISAGERVVIKPQLVWALRKAFTAVKVSRGGLTVTSALTLPVGFLTDSRWINHPLHGIRSRLLEDQEP